MMEDIWRDDMDQTKSTKSISQRLRDIHHRQSLPISLLMVIKSIKTEHKFELYLNIHNFKHRRTITKLRTRSLRLATRLAIETGRWDKVERENRICEKCLFK